MIHLDTNYLIGMVSLGSPLGEEVRHWLKSGERLGTSAVAWSEFLTGPFTPEQLRRAEAIVGNDIVPFRVAEAKCAAKLFNIVGRKRDKRIDSFIAATAIFAEAKLATRNRKDFAPFVAEGLRLA